MLRRATLAPSIGKGGGPLASAPNDLPAAAALLMRRRFLMVVAGGAIFLLLSILFALMFGPFGPLRASPTVADPMSYGDVVAALFGSGDGEHRAVVMEIRLPRILLAALVGTALALSGTTMQSVFRNPLAEPFILGISSGAALGAAANLVLGVGGDARYLMLPLLAFAGGLLAAFTAYGVARAAGRPRTETLLLAGVALNSLLTAALLAILFFAGEQFRSLFFWILGGFDRATWPALLAIGLAAGLGSLFIAHRSRALNLLMLGDDQAASLGVDVEREKRNLLVVSTLLASITVALAGAIGFVGLIIPHLLRLVIGSDNRLLVPAAGLGGATFLVWADLGARSVLATGELPVGIITAICGAPFFLYLLARRRGSLDRF
jgi:iron complex transport system permease protein